MISFKPYFTLAILFVTMQSIAQREYDVRYFGHRAGLQFNSMGIAPISGGRTRAYETATSMCDKNGNLLFYTDGDTVYNRTHQVMKNGVLQPANYFYRSSSFHGAHAVPHPKKNNIYYLFVGQGWEKRDINRFLRYSVIDMSLDGGMGEIIERDVPLLPDPGESFGITMHNNDTDYWIASIDKVKKQFNSIRTVNGEIDPSTKVNQDINIDFDDQYHRCNSLHEFSPDGTIFKGMNIIDMVNGNYKGYFSLYHFDNVTGKISDHLRIPVNGQPWAFEFSPNSRFLYVFNNGLYQYDLCEWDSAKIVQSRSPIYTEQMNTVWHPDRPIPVVDQQLMSLELGMGNKIYTLSQFSSLVSIIHNPDEKGAACNFQKAAINLEPNYNTCGGPSYPNFPYKTAKISIGPDRTMCIGDTITLICTTACNATNIIWNTGEKGNTIMVTKPGTYRVTATIGNKTYSDEIIITSGNKIKVYLGQDTAFCGAFTHLLDAGKGGKNYLWNTGDTTVTKIADSEGMYAVTVTDENSCDDADTIYIDRLYEPVISTFMDTINCNTVLKVQPQNNIKYQWSTGATTTEIKVEKRGTYSLTASTPFCKLVRNVEVTEVPRPEINLGPDTGICNVDFITLQANGGTQYKWNTGDTTPFLNVYKKGYYSVLVSKYNCTATDEIEIWEGCDIDFYIPNAFTPTADGLNEIFRVTGEHIEQVGLTIVDRWGEVIYQGNGLVDDVGWDGTYKDILCSEGVYFYMIKISGKYRGVFRTKNLEGSITLLR